MSRESGAPGRTSAAAHQDGPVERVRYRAFRALRLSWTAIGIPHAIFASVLLVRAGALRSLGTAVVVAEVVAVAVGWLFTERNHRAGEGVYIVAFSVLGLLALWTVGMTVGTAVALAWVCVACRVFYGTRAGLIAYACVALQLVVYGAWRHLGGGAASPWPGAVLVSTLIFVRYSLALLAGLAVLLATVGSVVGGFEESLAREQAMSSIGAEGIMVHKDGIILDANHAFAKLVGREIAELIGQNAFEVVGLSAASLQAIHEHARAHSEDTYDVEIARPDDGVLQAETSGRDIVYLGRQARAVSIRDISARKEMEAARTRLESSLRQFQKMETIGKLAGGIAHNFNNALGVILSCAEVLALVVPEENRTDVQAITAAARSSTALTRRLLSFARDESMVTRPVEVPPLLRLLVEILQRTLPKSISIVADRLGDSGDLVVLGDRSEFEHALLNLALNARDAMPNGGTLTLSCRMRTLKAADTAERPGTSPGAFVQIDVEDTGTGIPPEVLPRIFEPLFTTKSTEKGTGLGLSSVYAIVCDRRGAIDVHTELGKGTRFSVLLPLASETSCTQTVTRRPGAAIVVDDNPAQLGVVRRCALELFETVLEAADASEALEHLERRDGQVAAVVTDYDMPGMTGTDLAATIRERWPAVAVVVTSGTSGLHRDIGGLRLLRKPFSVAELDAAL